MADGTGLRDAIREYAEQRFTDAVAALVEDVQEAAPRDSGVMAASTTEQGRTSSEGRIETTLAVPVDYASYQDQGTGIYGPSGSRVYPVNGRALAWSGPSGMIFAASVAGVPATNFWSDHVTQEAWTTALAAP